jgi:hypothetical protein
MHLKPTAGCQISTLIFEKKLWRIGPLFMGYKKPQVGKNFVVLDIFFMGY